MKTLSALSALALLCLVSTMSYQDESNQQAHYCEMVELEAWPDYRDDIDCSKVEGK